MVNRGDDKTRHNRGQGLHYDIDLSIILLANQLQLLSYLSSIIQGYLLPYLYIIFTLIQVLTISYIHYLSPYLD